MASIIDIEPVIDLTGDFLKLKDSNPIKSNSRIRSLLSFLRRKKGTLADFPECGGKNTLDKLVFATESESIAILKVLEGEVKRYIDLDIQILMERDEIDQEITRVQIIVDGLPGMLNFGLQNRNNVAMILTPSWIEG